MTRITDWEDRGTCVLFGDGAGAVVLQPVQEEDRGLLSFELGADGSGAGLLMLPAGGGLPGQAETIRKENTSSA